MKTSERPTFWDGVFAGFAGFVALVQVVFASQLGEVAAMYREFGGDELPLLTRVTTHAAWLWGTSLVGVAAVATLLVKRPRSYVPYVVVVIALVVVAAMTYYFPRAPIYALAGNIQAE
jgi:hypothetical protein